MSGWIFLGITTLISVGLFLNGLRLARATENPLAKRRIGGLAVRGGDMSLAQVHRMGLLLMVAAPVSWLVVASLCFGVFGPLKGLVTIKLN